MSSNSSTWWTDDLQEVCVQFQLDLSCLVDRELDEVAAVRAIAHIEECSVCRTFFDDVREQVTAHRDLKDTGSLIERYSVLVGSGVADEIESIELTQKLASIFYQLGKAYVLTAIDPGFRTRVCFEKAVTVEAEQSRGRGFVDGVVDSGRGRTGGVDWQQARHILNGQLERIASPLDKGMRLLEETLYVDPTHEEARFYQAYVHARQGKNVRAASEFQHLFRTAVNEENRGHAALQLARLHGLEDEFKKALACCRWVTSSGLADSDPQDRFYVARFNIAMYRAYLRQTDRALAAFREMLDRHPGRAEDFARMLLRAPVLRAVIEQQQGFAAALVDLCPELFRAAAGASDPSGSEEDE